MKSRYKYMVAPYVLCHHQGEPMVHADVLMDYMERLEKVQKDLFELDKLMKDYGL